MYDRTDPRAALASSASPAATKGLIAEPQLGAFYDDPPTIEDAAGKTWLIRGLNFVIAYSELVPGGTLSRRDQPDEYVCILPEAPAEIEAGGAQARTGAMMLAMVPPGDSRVTLPEGGVVVRLFSAASEDLCALCPNAGAYAQGRSHIPDFAPWPDPPDGLRLRTYSYDIPPQEGRFGRIFRCTTFMVNMLYPHQGPRDTARMSPHHHDDFEQCSLALQGRFVHYLRWPWTTDMADWKPDAAHDMGAPSVCVIPPPTIHTSRASDAGVNQLVDIFAPPRFDFSDKPGWVLNAADYPMP